MAMPFDETPDRLDDHLNRLGSREGFEPREFGFEPMLAETVGRFHAMDARDREPEPDPIFLQRLEEDLMNAAISARVTRPSLPAFGTVATPMQHAPAIDVVGSQTRPFPGRALRRRGFSNLAAAAVILLTLAAGFAAYRLAPSDGPEQTPTLPAAAQAATPEATEEPTSSESAAIDIANCEAESRPDGAVDALVGTQPATTAILPRFNKDPASPDYRAQPVNADDVLANLPAAEPVVVAGVTATARELTACRFFVSTYDDPQQPVVDLDGRYFALFSDDYFRRELTGFREAGIAPTLSSWMPNGSIPLIVETVRTLPDGRAAAVLWAEDYGVQGRMLVIFAKSDDRWLVDEFAQVTSDTAATAPADSTAPAHDPTPVAEATEPALDPAPEAAAPTAEPQYLEVVLTDDGGFMQITPGELPLRANEFLFITVANLGTQPHRFEIAGAGIGILTQPGHSESTILVPAVGEFEVHSAVIDADGQSVERFKGLLTFTWQGEGTMTPQG